MFAKVGRSNFAAWDGKDMITRNDIVNSKREACIKAAAEGHAAGMAEGAAESKREVAEKMKAEGIPAEVIAKCTGLTVEDVEAL